MRPLQLNLQTKGNLFLVCRCHSGELYFTFGTLGQANPGQPFRDQHDLPFEQVTVDVWTAFARAHDPNPATSFLAARGFFSTAATLAQWGPWQEVRSPEPVRLLGWPSRGSGWLEKEQCELVGFPLDFFED